nr:hypothetical protein [Moritella viscosa]SHO12210.1 Putative uncharacterized protein [Moritella viscosa]
MSNTIKQRPANKEGNPFVSFDKEGNGVSRIYDEKWDFTALGQNKKKISFTGINAAHRTNVQDVMYTILNIEMSQSDSDYFTVSTMKNHVENFSVIVRYWECSDFSLLSQDKEWKKFKNSFKGHYSMRTLCGIAVTLNKLHNLGIVQGQYFTNADCRELKDEGKSEKQHIALPACIHAQILKQTYQQVEKYHPHRYIISEVMKAGLERNKAEVDIEKSKGLHDESSVRFNANVAKRTRGFMNRLAKEKGIPDFNHNFNAIWLKKLMIDCLVCIAFFSGMRKRELLSLNKDSYKIDQVTSIPKLLGMLSKTNKGEPIQATWQTDPIVKKTLELVYGATEFARVFFTNKIDNELKNSEISQDTHERFKKELSCAFIKTDIGKESNKKADYLICLADGLGVKRYNIKATEDDIEEFDLLNPDWIGELELGGTLPKFSLHDLRRSFAVFMVRNRLGNALTVKHQFKHLNLYMSKWYANYAELARDKDIRMDEELFAGINEAIEEACIDGLDDIYNKTSITSGVEGEKIAEHKREKLEKGEQVYLSRNELKALLKSGDKSLVILPTGGYCTSRDCERLCSMSSITEQRKNCGRVMTDEGARKQARERDRLVEAFRGMNELEDYALSTILSGHKKKIIFIEQTLEAHNLPFVKFTDKINASTWIQKV